MRSIPIKKGRRVLTLALAAAGTGAFAALSLPLPFLFGPLLACLLAALVGFPLKSIKPLSLASRMVLGVAAGAAITPQVAAMLPEMALSLALLPIYLAVIALIGVPFFERVCGFDRPTSWYAAMPGGFQDMVLFGIEAGGDARALSLVHATRVLIIVTIAPILITQVFGSSLDGELGEPASSIPWYELLLMVAAALIGWKGGEAIGLFGAAILGPLLVTAALTLTDFIHFRPPTETILAAQFFIGIGIGAGYVGVTLYELRRDVLAGIFFVLILCIVAAVFAEIVVLLGIAPPLEGFLAFAPGGQAEMVLLAIIVGADIGYVVVHHMMRLFLVITCAPLAATFFGAGGSKKAPD